MGGFTFTFHAHASRSRRAPVTAYKWNTGLTQRLHSAHVARQQHAHFALEDPTRLPQRPHSSLSSALGKRQAAACHCACSK